MVVGMAAPELTKAIIWRWPNGNYRAHVSAEQYEAMKGWTGVQRGGVYVYPDRPRRYDIQFPRELLSRVKQSLNPKSAPKAVVVAQ